MSGSAPDAVIVENTEAPTSSGFNIPRLTTLLSDLVPEEQERSARRLVPERRLIHHLASRSKLDYLIIIHPKWLAASGLIA